MKGADPKYPDDRAKDVGLFEIQVNQVGGFTLDVLDRLCDVNRR